MLNPLGVNQATKQLLGVVMCGGKSLRMGTDKGLIRHGEKTWAQLTYALLAGLDVPVRVSVNPAQLETYRHLFTVDMLVADQVDIPGPLAGIMSLHQAYPEADLLILACDMMTMDGDTLKLLIDSYLSNRGHDYYAYHNEQFYEPLCAIYTALGLSSVKEAFDNGALTQYSLQHLLGQGSTYRLVAGNKAAFANYNTP